MPMDHIVELITKHWQAGEEVKAMALYKKYRENFSEEETAHLKAFLSSALPSLDHFSPQELEKLIKKAEIIMAKQGFEF